MKPGVYQGLPMAEYLAIEAVSAGVICTLDERCEAAAWHESYLNPERVRDAGGDEARIGTVAHSIFLEGSTEGVAVIDPRDHPAEKTGSIPDGWTNKSIRAARDAAIARGQTPILLSDFRRVERMVEALTLYVQSLQKTEPAVYELFQAAGESELTMVWDDATGVRCRMRPDRIALDRKLIVNLKTVMRSAEPNAFGRTLPSSGHHMNAAFYRRGVKALCDVEATHLWLVQEQAPPHLCSLIGMEPAFRDFADEKVARGLSRWASCVRAKVWPAYPNRVAYVELPPWEQARAAEREAVRGYEYSPEQLFEKRRETFASEHDPAV